MVEVFNHLNLDAFVIGNHEFDWGLEEIMVYFNDEENDVKANFPILGANVKLKSTNQRPEFIDSHVIVKRGNVKIGIVGVMGDGLEGSIATPRVEDYYFSDAYQAVIDSVNEIKNEVDFILVVNHHGNQDFNEKVARLDKVSAIFNGHTHQAYTGETSGVPYIQSASNARLVGRIALNFQIEDEVFSLQNFTTKNISSHSHLNKEDTTVANIINKYYDEISYLYTETILISSSNYGNAALSDYMAKVMVKSSGAVVGFHNSGGTRSTFGSGQNITAADVFQVFPFENLIVTAEVSGSTLKTLLNNSYFTTYSEINYSDIINTQTYKIAANDYVFYSKFNENTFGTATNVVVVADMYEKLYETMYLLKASGKTHFNTNDEIDFWN